jgi:hypothetical protein
MKKMILAIAILAASPALPSTANATASMDSCNNSTGECRARLTTVYSTGTIAYVVLEGHLVPSACTSIAWGRYWAVPLSTEADKARYAMLLSAYMAGKPVEIRALDAACTVIAAGVGE